MRLAGHQSYALRSVADVDSDVAAGGLVKYSHHGPEGQEKLIRQTAGSRNTLDQSAGVLVSSGCAYGGRVPLLGGGVPEVLLPRDRVYIHMH